MKIIRRLVPRATAPGNRIELTFGLREAAIMSVVGIAIAVVAVYYYAS
jgi:hypothetical protein